MKSETTDSRKGEQIPGTEIHTVVSHSTWVLRTEFWSSRKTVQALPTESFFPALLKLLSFMYYYCLPLIYISGHAWHRKYTGVKGQVCGDGFLFPHFFQSMKY